jgi:hypothetical protein
VEKTPLRETSGWRVKPVLGARFVVHVHEREEISRTGQCYEISQLETGAIPRLGIPDIRAGTGKALYRSAYGIMFRPGCNHTLFSRLDDRIVRFGTPARENHFGGLHVQKRGYPLPGGFDGMSSLTSLRMNGGRIPPVIPKKREHGTEHLVPEWCRSGVVQVNGIHDPANACRA